MNFASPTYGLFLVAVLAGYWALPWRRAQHALLLIASYTFYAWWDWRFSSLLLVSTVIDFLAGARVDEAADTRVRRRWLWVSLAANLGLLGFFKYYGFFVDNAMAVLHAAGIPASRPTLQVILPVGISFFTFQSMSYTLDIYFGHLRPVRDFIQFALYVSFFPQLVAGPIVRAREYLPQLMERRVLDWAQAAAGFERILAGLVKKVVIADSLALFCDPLFSNPLQHSSADGLIGLVAFYGQIYCDFSGYTDIAIGSAALLGFRFRENFDRPYLARTPQEFWRRWHISLSTWLRDYLYIPLGGNRRGPRLRDWNLLVTMVLGGLWHGAAWHFLFWGAWHGALLVAFHRWQQAEDRRRIPTWALWVGTQAAVCIGWGLFRLPDTPRLWAFVRGVFRYDFEPSGAALEALALCAIVVAAESARPLWTWLGRRPLVEAVLRPLAYVACIYAILALGPVDTRAFIYFQF